LYIEVPLKLQPENGLMNAETCSCCVLLINHILCNTIELDYKFIYYINYWKHNTMPHLNKKNWIIINHQT